MRSGAPPHSEQSASKVRSIRQARYDSWPRIRGRSRTYVDTVETGVVLFTPEGHEDRIGTFVSTSWEVDNIDKTYGELVERGVEFAKPPEKQPWGTVAIMKDSEGNQIVLAGR